MAVVVPDEAEVNLLNLLVGAGLASVQVYIRLFQNNLTPSQSTVLGDFTSANFSGYSSVQPTFGSASTVSHKGTITDTSSRDFICNGGGVSNTIYGYYVIDSTNMKLLWCERFSASQAMANNGDKITITLNFTLNSEN